MELSVQTTGMPEVIKMLEGMDHLVDEQLLSLVGERVVSLILHRVSTGRDINDALFAPYSAKYKLFREEKGRQGSPVNLFFTGQMLGAMTHKIEGSDTVKIFFNHPLASAKASGNQRTREFFGMSLEEIRKVTELIESELKTRMTI